MLHLLSPLSSALLYIPPVCPPVYPLFQAYRVISFADRHASISLPWHILFPTSGMSSTHLIGLITFFLSFNTQSSEKLPCLPSPHHCPTSQPELGILGIPSHVSHGSLIIAPTPHYNCLFVYVLIDYKLGAWIISYSFLYILAHNSTWYIVSGQ